MDQQIVQIEKTLSEQDKRQREDHDVMIRIESAIVEIKNQMQRSNDGLADRLTNHDILITDHSKRLDILDGIVDKLEPFKRVQELRILQDQFNNFITAAKTARYISGAITGIISTIIVLLAFQIPSILKIWGIWK